MLYFPCLNHTLGCYGMNKALTCHSCILLHSCMVWPVPNCWSSACSQISAVPGENGMKVLQSILFLTRISGSVLNNKYSCKAIISHMYQWFLDMKLSKSTDICHFNGQSDCPAWMLFGSVPSSSLVWEPFLTSGSSNPTSWSVPIWWINDCTTLWF